MTEGDAKAVGLSPTQRDIFRALALGPQTSFGLAWALFISTNNVQVQITNMRRRGIEVRHTAGPGRGHDSGVYYLAGRTA